MLIICFCAAACLLAGLWFWAARTQHLKAFQDALEKIEGFMLDLIVEAERAYREGTGPAKKAYVLNLILNSAFYMSLPRAVRGMVTYEVLSNMVDMLVREILNQLHGTGRRLREQIKELD